MTILTEDMRRIVDQQRLAFMATVCADGSPNLSPKGLIFVLDDEHLVIGDVRSPRTVANLSERPLAEINVVDPIARKGFRFKGACRVCATGDEFDRLVAFLRNKGARSPLRSVIVMRVERALPLISPAYDGGATELEVRRQWKRRMDELHSDLD